MISFNADSPERKGGEREKEEWIQLITHTPDPISLLLLILSRSVSIAGVSSATGAIYFTSREYELAHSGGSGRICS